VTLAKDFPHQNSVRIRYSSILPHEQPIVAVLNKLYHIIIIIIIIIAAFLSPGTFLLEPMVHSKTQA
jgi:hypothetical protein